VLAKNHAGLPGPLLGLAIRNRLGLHTGDCGVPPRNSLKKIEAMTWA
jgi:hypothetical protein